MNPQHIEAWNHQHIAAFLTQYKCAHHAPAFKDNDITGTVILDLGQDELRELGVVKVGERVRLLSGIKELRRRTATGSGSVPGTPMGIVHRPSTRRTPLSTRTGRSNTLGWSPVTPIELQVNGRSPTGDASDVKEPLMASGLASTSGSIKRLNGSRPPPLDLHQTSHSLSPNHGSSNTRQVRILATPRDTSATASVPAPQTSRRLRPPTVTSPTAAPPSSTSLSPNTRRSTSPNIPVAAHLAREFMDRPLPARPDGTMRPAPSRTGSHTRGLSASASPGPHPYAATRATPTTGESPRKDRRGTSPAQEYAHQQQQQQQGRPKMLGRSQSAQAGVLSLDAVRRRCVKFILADDGSTRVVDLDRCGDGVQVMEKVLKKFGKAGSGGVSVATGDGDGEDEDSQGERALVVDGWVVTTGSPGHESDPLTEREIMAICQASLDDPVRARGLTLRRMRKQGNRKDIEGLFGEVVPKVISPTSPSYLTATATQQGKRTNRASMSSVMSALGVNIGNPPVVPPTIPEQPAQKSPSSGSFLASRGKKMYNFFGHRPPSELISTHLADYFPAARRKDLERGYRNSMLRVGSGTSAAPPVVGDSNRASYASSRASSLEQNQLPSRFSVASSSSGGTSARVSSTKTTASPAREVPKVSVPDDPSPSDDAPLPRRPRPASIFSTRSRKLHRRQSETPSMLTVDEITAEFEQRRASVITFAESEQEAEEAANRFSASGAGTGVGVTGPAVHRSSKAFLGGLMPQPESEEEWNEDSFEEEESEDEDEESEEEEEPEIEDEQGKAFTSTGDTRNIKWIKGALIGAGSFGQVYLGMDAHSGLLMAVKQVDLSMGVQNEEKKKSMMTALQREIELLRDLQHENIVQYLDSSADEKHLNIFLEYVPGGSVTALLRNYGAFEEALVKNFVRQILTGLEYLHDKGIVHRDIKGANILVDNKGGVKISDFGISKKVENNLLSTMRLNRPSLQGSVFWMAPEVVKQTAYTKKADIWSVGCLVIEMLTGEHPWPDLTQMQAIFRIGQMSKPTIPTDISPDAVAMLEATFEIDHHARPDASELLTSAWLSKGA
ncbi:hypothetical protein QFC20_002527 [Naganishia adeliensis]|uniref:Uncharacterized protein n=1 Tax=Naganishia adeliensis TaxID=92952 RepID=A0ACC2WK55_9TREE|nr:hypothetical protein QFC20_002527 [Naganishia adeliensis]